MSSSNKSNNPNNPNPKNLQEVIREEIKKCLVDPIYFMKKYVKIQHPIRGTIPFSLYPFQETTLKDFAANDFSIVLKSRQMGISTLISAYSLYLMIFNKDKNILVISTKQEIAKEIVSKVRFANDNLPSWLKVPWVENNRLSLKLKNGSRILATSAAGDAGRSFALSLLIMDEAAFIEGVDEIWTAAYPTLSTGGRAIILSTPNGVGNFFHRMWVKAEAGENDFKTIKLPWHLHPERDQAWRDDQTRVAKTPKEAAQELDCDFLTSGISVVDLPTVQWYKKERQRDPIDKVGFDKGLWIWEYPNYSKPYIVCLPTGEHVLTNSGIKKIEDVTYEDKLINKDGHYTDIVDIKVRPYTGKIYEIKPSNTFRTTKFTDEHPILVSQSSKLVRMYKKDDVDYVFNQRYWKHDFQFVNAKNVKVGDWICYPNKYKKISLTGINQIWDEFKNVGRIDFHIKNNPLQHKDFWWFVGIWIAEGWISKDKENNIRIIMSHNSNEIEIHKKICDVILKLTDRKVSMFSITENNTTYTSFSSKQIGMFLETHFGKYASGKFISENIKHLSEDIKKELIKGFIEGDGCFIDTKTNGKNSKITSISLKLLEDVQDILFSIGCISTINLLRNEKKSKIKGKIVNQKETYSLIIHDFGCSKLLDEYIPKSKTQRISDCYFSNDEDYIYFRVKKVKELEYDGLVHNFTTSTGTFLCKNITTHNCADVARGDGSDYSAFHIINAETLTQCAEYKGQIDCTDYGHMLIAEAVKYNNALLIVENTGVGWSTIQALLDVGYGNTYYSTSDLKYVDVQRQIHNKYYSEDKKMVPGFSMTMKTRPLIISSLEQYFRSKELVVYSTRTLTELETFIWDKGKAQAMGGFNDDLIISLGIGLWVRDTALRLRSEGLVMTKQMIGNIGKAEYTGSASIYTPTKNTRATESWRMRIGKQNQSENLSWLL